LVHESLAAERTICQIVNAEKSGIKAFRDRMPKLTEVISIDDDPGWLYSITLAYGNSALCIVSFKLCQRGHCRSEW
jgi:hypothetical protein